MRRNPGIESTKDAVNPPELIALRDYTAPTLPTDRLLQATWARLKRKVLNTQDAPLQQNGLDRISLAQMQNFTEASECEPLLQALDAQFGDGSCGTGTPPRLCTLIVPPCDHADTLATWAKTRGHQVLGEPQRTDLTQLNAKREPFDLSGPGFLVIPRLEHWFVRERNGLHTLRALLSQLANTERRCIVGCNSWAWRFVVKSADADLSLAPPQTFEPFNARRLRDWFATLALDSNDCTATFRLAGNGEDVLACDSDGEQDWDSM